MCYRLRTLMILLVIGPPLMAGAWWGYQREVERRRKADFDRLLELIEQTVAPEPWNGLDGPGEIDRFDGALSLVIGTGQTIHEQPASDE